MHHRTFTQKYLCVPGHFHVQWHELHAAPRLRLASTVKLHQRLAARGPSPARPTAQTALPAATLPVDAP